MQPEDFIPQHPFHEITFGKMVPLAYELPPVTTVLEAP